MLATLALALGVVPAYAHDVRLHMQTANGSETSSRQGGGCSITRSSGSLVVGCTARERATLVYTFSSGTDAVRGVPSGWPYDSGHATVRSSTTASGRTIRLTVTVTGGSATITSVCVSYYA
jgi:hypothetical protein